MDELGSFFNDVQEEELKVEAELVAASTGSKRKVDEVDDMEVPVEDSQKSHKRVKSLLSFTSQEFSRSKAKSGP